MNREELDLSHLDKVYFPDSGMTKGNLLDYYSENTGYILPYIKNRPHSLLRQPEGIAGKSFFQKNVDHIPPDWIKTKAIYSKSTKENIRYLICDSTQSLLYMVQLGCIEINPWNSRIERLDRPDWLILDLDPQAVEFKQVIAVAQEIRRACDELQLTCRPKTSGKTGIHIYIPLSAQRSYKQVRQLAKAFAMLIYQRTASITSLERDPKKREHKVYIDYLQNSKGQTVAAPYSVRPTKSASISTPLHWDEVKPGLDPNDFTIKTMRKRLKRVGDLWKPVLAESNDIDRVLSEILK